MFIIENSGLTYPPYFGNSTIGTVQDFPMVGLAIASILGFPVVFLAIGFYGVSRKRAEEGREHLEPPLPVSTEPTTEPVQNTSQPMSRSGNPNSLSPMNPAPGGMPS